MSLSFCSAALRCRFLPTEDGNIFEGWVDKATGEPVKKGDKLTGNIELEPIWKDCGEGNHTDTDDDNRCDDCGYITVKSPEPEETTSAEETTDIKAEDTEKQDESSSGMPAWLIVIICAFGGLTAACTGVVIASKKKKQ